jgi:hypothetical protein
MAPKAQTISTTDIEYRTEYIHALSNTVLPTSTTEDRSVSAGDGPVMEVVDVRFTSQSPNPGEAGPTFGYCRRLSSRLSDV